MRQRVHGTRGTTWNRNFTHSFWRSNLIYVRKGCAGHFGVAILPQFLTIEHSFHAKGLRRTLWNRNFTSVFWRSNLISCERVARDNLKSQSPQFLTIEPHFVRQWLRRTTWNRNFTSVFDDRTSFRAKGLRWTTWNRNFTSVFDDRTSFCAKGLRGKTWNRNFTSVFWRSNLISCEKFARDTLQIAILLQFLAIELHFVRRGCAGRLWNRNFTSVFDDRTSFHAKALRRTTLKSQFYLSFWRSNLISCERFAFRAVSSALPLHAPAFRREIEKKERARGQEEKMWRCDGKRARGKKARGEDVKMWGCEDVKMWGWEDVKMSRCEDAKMWRWADVKMRRCEDVKMRRCEDEKMWRWEDEIQTPTIGRTLRSDALGKKNENRDANKFPLARAIQNNRKTQFHTGFLSWGFHIMSLINARPYP